MPVVLQLQLLYWYWSFIVVLYAADAKMAPEITEGPVDVTEFVDNRLMMACSARGDPRPSIQWQKRNGTGGRWLQVSRTSERYKVQRNGNLVIRRLLASDAGLFRCVAENTVGSAYSAAATLVVQAPAEIISGPRDHQVIWGTEVVLECEVVGVPFPNRSWTKNGKVIVNRQTHGVSSQARLRINATDSAQYSCHAENVHKHGLTSIARSATVRVVDGRCAPYDGVVCRHVLGLSSPVYVRASVANVINVTDSIVADLLSRLTTRCRSVTVGTLCRYTFPSCAGTAGLIVKSKSLCRESCDALLRSRCLAGIDQASFLNCTSLPSRNSSESCSVVELNNVTGENAAAPKMFRQRSLPVNEVVIAVVASIVLLFSIVIIILVVRIRRGVARCQRSTATSPPPADNIDIDVTRLPLNDAYVPPQTTLPDSENSSLLSTLECPRNGLQYCEDLRPGAFGPIFIAHAPSIAGWTGPASSSLVVVKALRSDASDEARRDFIRIGELLSRLDHLNIVRLLGVCLSANPLCLIVEYMPGRDLCEFLHESAPQHFIVRHGLGTSATRLKPADLIGAARQIACAMVYVSNCRILHRDLAARNCLVGDRLAPQLEVKLSDFGLAVELGDQDSHCGDEDEEIPVRWMPPEAIRENRFTFASDVWSFGVLLWEIFTFGAQPYDHMSIKEVIRYIDGGDKTLNCPEHASNAVYEQMRLCWRHNPSERPPFRDLLKQLVILEDLARSDIRYS